MKTVVDVGDKRFELFIANEAINERTKQIGVELNKEYRDRCPLFIGVLNGSFLFMADLLKEIKTDCEVGFIKVSSYTGTESTGKVKEVFGISTELKGRDIVIVEDIVDTGFTLKFLLEKLYEHQPASVVVCSLLYKPAALQYNIIELKYTGFEISNDFVVGYGLDYNGLGRNLNDIYRIVPDNISLT